MERTRNNGETATTTAQNGPIEVACRAFEMELQQGRKPTIENFIAGWEEPEQSKLLYELVRVELQFFPAGHGTQDEYLARFPNHREVVEEAFLATMAAPTSDEVLVMNSSLRLRSFLGQGGLGVVYVAQDEELERDTAVKFIQDKLKTDSRSREQFRLESAITGRLEHPGIVPVHGVGQTADGRVFYVMRLIRGEGLDKAIAKYYQRDGRSPKDSSPRELGYHELLSHFVAVCKTIAYAHNRGVVHRDIKPGNIMLGRYGETMVIDWGLGAHVARKGPFKDSDEKTLMPSSGTGSTQNSRGGTPPYMSPEQAAGREELGPLSDIYSLGATLYTIITGKVPFTGSHSEILDKVPRGEFRRPTEVRKGVSRALEAICLKAMSLDPQRRYETALELAEDVERYLADAPVSAYEEPVTRRIARWARRNRTMAQSGFVALLLFAVTGSGAAMWMGRQAHRERQLYDRAEIARKNEQSLRKQGLQLTATFAARTIANQIDLRWRVLEKEAADSKLHALLETSNAASQNDGHDVALQQWLDRRVKEDYSTLSCRAWSVYAKDGTHAARSPIEEDGKKASSLGQNFAFRDYFHGMGKDYSKNERLETYPLTEPHVSTAFRSMIDGQLVFTLSVPIRTDKSGEPLGVLTTSIELGDIADLKLPLSDGKGVILVDSRQYYMLPYTPPGGKELRGERGDGLVLHHRDWAEVLDKSLLPHVDDDTIHFVREATSRWKEKAGKTSELNKLLPDSYRDPVTREEGLLAAFAPVLIDNRPVQQRDTGWFVIVQQAQ